MWRVIRIVLSILAIAVWTTAGAVVAFRAWVGGGVPTPASPPLGISDALIIALSAITVFLAALAIVLAIAGAVGYVTIKDAARRAAEQKAEKVSRAVAQAVAARTAEETIRLVAPRGIDASDAFAAAMREGNRGDDEPN